MEPLRSLVHVGIVVAMTGAVGPSQMHELKTEVSRLWKPYGVALTWFDHDEDCASAPLVDWVAPVDLLVRLSVDDETSPRRRRDRPVPSILGSVQFAKGIPEHAIHIRYKSVAAMVIDSRYGGWMIGALPHPLRDQFIGRALGRVAAHELGHVLLGAPVHANTGLMRAWFSAADLTALDIEHLRLSAMLVGRLHDVAGAHPAPGW